MEILTLDQQFEIEFSFSRDQVIAFAEVTGDIVFGPRFGFAQQGTVSDGLLDGVGGVTGLEKMGSDRLLLRFIPKT